MDPVDHVTEADTAASTHELILTVEVKAVLECTDKELPLCQLYDRQDNLLSVGVTVQVINHGAVDPILLT